jgi:predicted TPR repeat methyltransferase
MTTIRQVLETALQHHSSGRLTLAAEHYRAALEIEPDHAAALHMLGVLEHQRNNPSDAIHLIGRAVELDPGEADYHGNLGAVLLSVERLEEAITELEIALRIQPGYIDAHINLANALDRAGDREGAEFAWRQALEQDDRNVGVWNAFGRFLSDGERQEEAVQAHQTAIQLGDDQAETWFLLGNALQASEQITEAIQAYESARKIAPDAAAIHSNLGKAFKDSGDLNSAINCYLAAIELDPDLLSAHYNKGVAYMEMRRGAEATAAFETTLCLDPTFTPAIRGLARIADSNDDLETARRYLERWQEVDPDDPEPVHLLTYYDKTNMPSRAPDDYVRRQFDQFARDYDQKLERLENQGPEILAAQLEKMLLRPDGSLDILDTGCGTGLCGSILRPWASRLTGVDLSAGMLKRARRRGLYDELVEQELTAFLRTQHGAFDVIASSDTFNYFGDLQPVFIAAHQALRPGGHLFFNVEANDAESDDASYRLQRHGRYCHTKAIITTTLEKAGFTLQHIDQCVLRVESKRPVVCFAVIARMDKPGSNKPIRDHRIEK